MNLWEKIKKYALGAGVLSIGAGFVTNLLAALSDGTIDSKETHELIAGANGVEAIVLLIVIYMLKRHKK